MYNCRHISYNPEGILILIFYFDKIIIKYINDFINYPYIQFLYNVLNGTIILDNNSNYQYIKKLENMTTNGIYNNVIELNNIKEREIYVLETLYSIITATGLYGETEYLKFKLNKNIYKKFERHHCNFNYLIDYLSNKELLFLCNKIILEKENFLEKPNLHTRVVFGSF
jgi:hypothetical protein